MPDSKGHSELARKIAQRVKDAIRADCSMCGGTGISGTGGGIEYVTRDMAFDAGQPEREGEAIDTRHAIECEYCGRPMEAVDASLIEAELQGVVREWKPIESAPNPGIKGILVWEPKFQSVWMVYWHKDRWLITGTKQQLGHSPTHWQPLPEPPQ